MAFLLLSCVADSPGPVGPEPEPQGVPVAVAAVSGAGQTGATGGALGGALLVRVTDAGGRGVRGVAVAWTVSPDGGTLSAASTATDSAGEARATWTLGTAAGTHTVTASVSGLPAATFTATAVPPQPAKLEAAGGDGQSAAAGSPLADSLAVRVSYADGRPAPGVAVAWAATGGGGAVSAASTTTGADGVARVRWTLGSAAGENTAQAGVAGLAGSPVTFRATARAGGASALSRVGGDGQSATVGTALPSPLAVRVADAGGNPVAGASVTWMVTAGGGSVTPAIATTDAEGVARAAWTLGTTAGANAVTAAAAGATAGFTATGTPGPAARVERAGGDGQSAPAGSTLAAPLVVRVADVHGNAVEGATVGWAATAGGGSISPASSRTDAAGRASAAWTLGAAAGANAATATVAGAGSAAFAAAATAGGAAGLGKVSGDGQSAPVGSAVAAPLVVRVTDAHGNAVAGASVAWAATAGGGALAPAAATTDAAGQASARWTLGAAAGANTATASVAGAAPVSFAATATASQAGVVKVSGDGQTGTVGTGVAAPLVVRVVGADGGPVANTAVAWAVSSGTAVVEPEWGPATNAEGYSNARLALGAAAGPVTVTATAGGVSVVFSATSQPAAAAKVVLVSGGGQTGGAGTVLPDPVVVRAVDRFGNPTPGVQVEWGPLGLVGSFSPNLTVAGADGTTSSRWTLAAEPGPNEGMASARVALSEFVRFSATGVRVASPVAAVVKTSGDGYTGEAGLPVQTPVLLVARDAGGKPVAGAAVAWTASSGGKLETGTSAETRADGTAGAAWRLGPAAGTQTLTAVVGGVAVTYTATAVAGQPHRLTAVSGDGQTGEPGTALPAQLVVLAEDQLGNRVSGAEIRWLVSAFGGSVGSSITRTGADGTVRVTWTLGSSEGRFQATATLGSSGPSVSFAAASVAAVAAVAVPTPTLGLDIGGRVQLVATLTDATGRVLTGRPVSWSSSAPGVATVDGAGLVTGVGAGTATITATSEGKSGSAPVTVSGRILDSQPPQLKGLTIDPQTVDVGSGPATVQIRLSVTDQTGVSHPWIFARSPSGTLAWCMAVLVEGTAKDGVWRCSLTIPANAEAGTWTIDRIQLEDEARNQTLVRDTQLKALGLPHTVLVTSTVSDGSPPVLAGLTFTPTQVDVSAGSAQVEVVARMTDALTGVRRVDVAMQSPSRAQRAACGGTLASGTVNDGAWKCVITVPQGAEAGTWMVEAVTAWDRAENMSHVTTSAIAAVGGQTSLTVLRP